MKKLTFLIITLLVVAIQSANCQVETKYYPDGKALQSVPILAGAKASGKMEIMPSFDVGKLIEEDKLNEGLPVPYRFGNGFDVCISLEDGTWTKVENGRLWSMTFHSKGAYSLNFVFDKLNLPYGAELYIVNSDQTIVYGPVSSEQRITKGVFLTDIIPGETATIHLYEPSVSEGMSVLGISRVVHGYRMADSKGYMSSGSCNNDIACYSSWSTESDAVALVLLSNGTEHCSGSLLMTTDYSFKPYFLTAFHCIDTYQNGVLSSSEIAASESWLFKFDYKKASCNGSGIAQSTTYNGATFRAAWYYTDFALMELNASLLGKAGYAWLGWDRSGDTPTSGTGIHHPSGDVMKISFENNSLNETGYLSNTGNGYWRTNWDTGITERGSSGSPLLNQNKRVIGQLKGGYSSCFSTDLRDWYGCFYLSWTGGGTNSTRLSNWLDPTGTGNTTTNTMYGPYISGPSTLCASGGSYTIANLPTGATITWQPSVGIQRVSAQGSNPCTFRSTGSGDSWVKATVHYGADSLELQKYVYSGVPPAPSYVNASNVDGSGGYYTKVLDTGTAYFTMERSSQYGKWWDTRWATATTHGGTDYYLDIESDVLGTNYVIPYWTNTCGNSAPGPSVILEIVLSRGASLTLSPNPAGDYVDVRIDFGDADNEPSSYVMEILNTGSYPVRNAVLSGGYNRVSVQGLQRGYYVVRIRYGDTVLTKPLMVE